VQRAPLPQAAYVAVSCTLFNMTCGRSPAGADPEAGVRGAAARAADVPRRRAAALLRQAACGERLVNQFTLLSRPHSAVQACTVVRSVHQLCRRVQLGGRTPSVTILAKRDHRRNQNVTLAVALQAPARSSLRPGAQVHTAVASGQPGDRLGRLGIKSFLQQQRTVHPTAPWAPSRVCMHQSGDIGSDAPSREDPRHATSIIQHSVRKAAAYALFMTGCSTGFGCHIPTSYAGAAELKDAAGCATGRERCVCGVAEALWAGTPARASTPGKNAASALPSLDISCT